MYKIYYKNLDDSNIVPNNVLEYLKKYHHQDRYNQSINSWCLLYEKLLSDFNIDLSIKEIKTTINGKPYIDDIYFSISHSKNMVCIMISDYECGIDIEKIDSSVKHELLSKKVLSKEEYLEYLESSNKLEYFISMWTKKEAFLKCFNEGILNFNSLRFKYKVDTFKINDEMKNEYYISFILKEEECIK